MRKMLLFMAVATLLFAMPAQAGQFRVDDRASFFNGSDLTSARMAVEQVPFEVHVIALVVDSQAQLEYEAGKSVTSPNVMVVAIDPKHHTTHVRYGAGLGIPAGLGANLARAGHRGFAAKRPGDGVAAIVAAAQTMILQSHVTVPSQLTPLQVNQLPVPIASTTGFSVPSQPVSSESQGHPVLWTLFFLSLAGVGAWLFFRRYKKSLNQRMNALEYDIDTARSETAVERDFNRRLGTVTKLGEGAVSSPTTRVSSYTPPDPRFVEPAVRSTYVPTQTQVVVHDYHDHGSGDLLTGMALGSMMNQPRERVIVEREVREPSCSSTPAASTGGSDSWASSSDDQPSSGGSDSWSSSSSDDSSSSVSDVIDSIGDAFSSSGGSDDW